MIFITHIAVGGVCRYSPLRAAPPHALNCEQASGVFNISFNSSIITRYCVERRVPLAGDWADYVSCDGSHANDYGMTSPQPTHIPGNHYYFGEFREFAEILKT